MAEPFQHFVDDYLAYLYEAHPTSATLDGNHVHDDLLDDLSRTAIDSHAGALAGFARRLQAIPTEGLPVDRPGRASDRPRQHRIAAVRGRGQSGRGNATRTTTARLSPRAWRPRRSSTFASETERARRVLSKLRQVPRLVQAARDNVKDPPAIFVKTGIDTFRGVMTFIDADLPRAFAGIDDMHLLADLADASTEAAQALSALRRLSRDRGASAGPRPRSGSDASASSTSSSSTKGCPTRAERLLHIAERELAETQEEFRTLAGRLNGGDPIEAWRKAKERRTPPPDTLIATAREQVSELKTFLDRNGVVDVPDGEAVQVAPTPGLPPLVVGQHVDAGPVRDPRAARHLLPDRRRSRRGPRSANSNTCATSISRRCGASRCTRCSPATSSTSSTCARSSRRCAARPCFAPTSYIEGWAHYCEQMMIEAGFGRRDHTVKLGQLAEALVRLARFVVGIRCTPMTGRWSRACGSSATRPSSRNRSARREAERGTFDPTLSRLLGRQADAAQAARTTGRSSRAASRRCARSTTRCWRTVRAVLGAATADARRRTPTHGARIVEPHAALRYQCDACGHRFEVIQKFSDAPIDVCPKCGRAGAEAAVVAGDPVQGQRLLHHRLRARRQERHGAVQRRPGQCRRESREVGPRRQRRQGRQGRARAGKADTSEKTDKSDSTPASGSSGESGGEDRATASPSTTPTKADARSRLLREALLGEVFAERLGQVGPPQREVDHRFQEAQLVAGVVADAVDFAGVDRARGEQPLQPVGELNLAGAILRRGLERREDVGRQE